jgi:hypothetical protein
MLIGFRQPELLLISEQKVENMFVSQPCGKPHVGSMYHVFVHPRLLRNKMIISMSRLV